MSSYWAGYSAIGMMLSQREMDDFIDCYKEKREKVDLLSRYLNIDLDDPDNLTDAILETEGISRVSSDHCEGLYFWPYIVDGMPNREYKDTAPSLRENAVFIFPADYDNNGIGAFFDDRKYSSLAELFCEFKKSTGNIFQKTLTGKVILVYILMPAMLKVLWHLFCCMKNRAVKSL